MLKHHWIATTLPLCTTVLCMSVVSGQDYPNRPIRLVTNAAGASADLATRIVAQGLSVSFSQAVVVDNRAGSTVIPTQIVAKAPADGHTLYGATTALWILPLLQEVPYDTLKDFAPIALTTISPSVLAVHPSVPATSLKELIALAKSKPEELTIGSGTSGSTTQLSSELFKATAKVNILSVPFKGAAPALNAVLAGQVQVIAISASSVMPHFRAGRLRALAVASAQPSALAAGVPTAAEAGLPGYESGVINGILAPAKTPDAIINRLNREIVRYLNNPETKERFFKSGMEVVGSSPREFAATIRSEIARWGKVIKDAGIRQN